MRTFRLTLRYYTFALCLVLLAGSTCLLPTAGSIAQTVAQKVIIVDAGHGGIDPGANRTGVLEKDINLAVALQLEQDMKAAGYTVILSRRADIDLSNECNTTAVHSRYHRDLMARLELVEETMANVFVSIHANAVANPKRKGAQVFFCPTSAASQQLAQVVHTELAKIVTMAMPPTPANYFVLRSNSVPAVLIEVGFITNPEERQLLQTPSHQQRLASAIAAGISAYLQASAHSAYLAPNDFK